MAKFMSLTEPALAALGYKGKNKDEMTLAWLEDRHAFCSYCGKKMDWSLLKTKYDTRSGSPIPVYEWTCTERWVSYPASEHDAYEEFHYGEPPE